MYPPLRYYCYYQNFLWIVFSGSVEAMVPLPFDDASGKIRRMTIIVCEVVDYLPLLYYDRKLGENISTYNKQVV